MYMVDEDKVFVVISIHLHGVQVEWGWQEPMAVGETMWFIINCFQRNGQPYPVCDTDNLEVAISHGTRKV